MSKSKASHQHNLKLWCDTHLRRHASDGPDPRRSVAYQSEENVRESESNKSKRTESNKSQTRVKTRVKRLSQKRESKSNSESDVSGSHKCEQSMSQTTNE